MVNLLTRSDVASAKKWYTSKTLWTAVVTGVVGIATAVVGDNLVSSQTAGYILVAVGVLNGILRKITSQPIG
jgi:hypothetical protein